MKFKTFLITIMVFLSAMSMVSLADTIYFKNENTKEGIVKHETDSVVELELASGTVSFPKKNILKIERSTPQELQAINKGWQDKREGMDKIRDAHEKERQRRFAEYDQWRQGEEAPKNEVEVTGENDTVPLIGEPGSNNMSVEVVLNGKIKAILILDTGADVVVLSRKVGESLGVDLNDINEMTEFHLAGDKRAKAVMITLKSVKVNGIEAKNVRAGVLLDENSGLMLRDGLLGTTFLNRFNFKIDRQNMKLLLERLK